MAYCVRIAASIGCRPLLCRAVDYYYRYIHRQLSTFAWNGNNRKLNEPAVVAASRQHIFIATKNFLPRDVRFLANMRLSRTAFFNRVGRTAFFNMCSHFRHVNKPSLCAKLSLCVSPFGTRWFIFDMLFSAKLFKLFANNQLAPNCFFFFSLLFSSPLPIRLWIFGRQSAWKHPHQIHVGWINAVFRWVNQFSACASGSPKENRIRATHAGNFKMEFSSTEMFNRVKIRISPDLIYNGRAHDFVKWIFERCCKHIFIFGIRGKSEHNRASIKSLLFSNFNRMCRNHRCDTANGRKMCWSTSWRLRMHGSHLNWKRPINWKFNWIANYRKWKTSIQYSIPRFR